MGSSKSLAHRLRPRPYTDCGFVQWPARAPFAMKSGRAYGVDWMSDVTATRKCPCTVRAHPQHATSRVASRVAHFSNPNLGSILTHPRLRIASRHLDSHRMVWHGWISSDRAAAHTQTQFASHRKVCECVAAPPRPHRLSTSPRCEAAHRIAAAHHIIAQRIASHRVALPRSAWRPLAQCLPLAAALTHQAEPCRTSAPWGAPPSR